MSGLRSRLRSADDLARWEYRIGAKNCANIRSYLAGGCDAWIFQTKDEIDREPDLSSSEKSQAKETFDEQNRGFVIWIRQRFGGCALPRVVYSSQDGFHEVEFRWSGEHNAHYLPRNYVGWRELPDGSRERVTFDIHRGWLNEQEAALARS